MQNLIQNIYNNLNLLKQFNTREFLVYKKLKELENFSIEEINQLNELVKKNILSIQEMEEIFSANKIEIEIVPCFSKQENQLYYDLLRGTTLMVIVSNPGRSIKLLIYEKRFKKVLGFLMIASDIISLKERENYIGWSKQNRLNNGKLQNIAIARIIVPTQPFGYYTNGGKLIALLCHSPTIKNVWEQKYNSKLVGITTTSLFGRPSMYDGMDKYVKNIGETKGMILLSIDDEYVKQIHKHLRETDLETYNKIIKLSGPKQKVMNYFLQKYLREFKEIDENFSIKNYFTNFKRGLYFFNLYENTREYLREETEELKNPLFNSNEEIVNYWFNKFAKKRFEKIIKENNKNKEYFYNLYEKYLLCYDIQDEKEKIQKFLELN